MQQANAWAWQWRNLGSETMSQYENAPRNRICAFHALSLSSLIYHTWCVGLYRCEKCFPSMARIPHCSCQWEGENVWQDLARFSKPKRLQKPIQVRKERTVLLWAFSGFVKHSVTSSFKFVCNCVSHNTDVNKCHDS